MVPINPGKTFGTLYRVVEVTILWAADHLQWGVAIPVLKFMATCRVQPPQHKVSWAKLGGWSALGSSVTLA